MAMEQIVYKVGLWVLLLGSMFTISSATVDTVCTVGGTECGGNEVCTTLKCACKPGYTGDSTTPCVDIDECVSNPCKNGGSCVNGVNEYTCTCSAGWTGTTCETAFDCNTHTCKNSGTCETAKKTCSCVTGYTGDDCGTDIDECASNPCKNDGTCVDGVNAYTCNCDAAWTGTTCETATVGVCTGIACPDTVDNGECSGTACVCKDGYQKEEDNCVFVPDNAAGKTTMAAVTMVMAVLTLILMHMF